LENEKENTIKENSELRAKLNSIELELSTIKEYNEEEY
jgi:hypothetical protein